MTAAACDKKDDGAIPEVAAAIAEKKGATKEQLRNSLMLEKKL